MKILIIRFSSIGDVVLTSPVIRCLKKQTGAEIHYLTKKAYATILQNNPYVDKLIFLEDHAENLRKLLRKESYDAIIDLHNNLRSRRFSLGIARQIFRFNKANFAKWILVNLKINQMPDVHIVDRYLDTTKSFGVKNDRLGLDYFHGLNTKDIIDKTGLRPDRFVAISIGGQHSTKKLPARKLQELVSKINEPIALLGGKEDFETGETIAANHPHVINLCGKTTLNESAAIIEACRVIITHDTGLMHMAAAFKKNILSVWGNTVPEFGMSPYMSGSGSKMIEVRGISCRPCSKIGFDACPKGHFNCMNRIETETIVGLIGSRDLLWEQQTQGNTNPENHQDND